MLNNNSKNIRLALAYSNTEVEFLDTRIYRDPDGWLQSDLYRKDTSVNSVLHASSSHPTTTKKVIPMGQFLRARRVCSQDHLFLKQAHDLTSRFQERGYRAKPIEQGFRRATSVKRDQLLMTKKKEPSTGQVRFIFTFNGRWHQMRDTMRKYWRILTTDSILNTCLPSKPSMTYRWSKSLRDLLVLSNYQGTTVSSCFGPKKEKWGWFPCGDCIACPNILRSTSFNSSTGPEFKITQRITCNTEWIIYYATCHCNRIYLD